MPDDLPPVRRRRDPVPRRVYRTRRIAALLVIALVGTGAFFGLRILLSAGASSGSAEAPVSSPSSIPASAGSQPRSATTEATATETTVARTTEPVNTGVPSASNPLTVYIAGDSEAGTFAPYLNELLDDTGMLDSVVDYKTSSGLARPDFFNWPEHLRDEVPDVNPDIIIVTFGGNDSQGLAVESGDFIVGDPTSNTQEWTAEYRKRVKEVLDIMTEGGRTVIWVGVPNDDNPDVTARLRVQDQAVRAEVAAHPGVYFIDTWRRFSGRNGNWSPYVIDPRDGEGKPVRHKDGFHLNENGAEILALDIFDVISEILGERGATLDS